MSRRLRFNGTGSGEGGCPAVHEDLDSGEVIVQGPPLQDPEDIARLKHMGAGEVAVVVPRNTLADFGPRDETPRIIDLEAFGRLFENFKYTAWRLETRRRYASDEETATYAQFVAGEQPSWDYSSSWCRTISAKTSMGARVGRVRVVDDPATVGQRYLMAHAVKNVALGEGICLLRRDRAEAHLLGDEDFWIFDSRLIAVLRFDDEDNFVDVELITEPARVARYVQLRDVAQHYATPQTEFPLHNG